MQNAHECVCLYSGILNRHKKCYNCSRVINYIGKCSQYSVLLNRKKVKNIYRTIPIFKTYIYNFYCDGGYANIHI